MKLAKDKDLHQFVACTNSWWKQVFIWWKI